MKRVKYWIYCLVFTTILFGTNPQKGVAQYDLNGNGTLDLPMTLHDGDKLRWFGQDLTTDEVFQLGLFGHPNYQVSIGHWVLPDTITRVFVRRTLYGSFELLNDSNDAAYPLGQLKNEAIVFLGRDVDSSGLLDAVLLNGERSKWSWKFSFDPLSLKSSKRRILYGTNRDIPFLFRARGSVDALGLLKVRGKRSKIKYRALIGTKKRYIRLRGFVPPSQQPLLIRGKEGRDSFAFVEGKRVRTISRRGKADSTDFELPESGTLLAGDFNGDGQESIATFVEGKVIFNDGETKRLSDESVKPLSPKSAESYKKAEASPTIAPTLTRTPPPLPSTSPTPVPSMTATSTGTPAFIPTSTPFPTYTLQPTYTYVPRVPTYTPYPTSTPVNTLTPTATPSATPTRGAFISTWNTSHTGGTSNNDQITLPLVSSGTYNFTVEWGDGVTNTITSWNQTEVTHTYSSAGVYKVKITGSLMGFRFNNSGDKTKIVDINQWGILRLGNGGSYFKGCSNLNSTATDALDLTGTTDLTSMFRNAQLFNGNISSWDTSMVENMKDMFYAVHNFNQDISSWDTSKVEVMQGMFARASNFDQNISGWNISSVNNSSFMFHKAHHFNQDISAWNTSSITNMSNMFNDSKEFDKDLSGWCVLQIGSKPSNFDSGASNWTNGTAWQPQWGTCP